MEDFEYGVIQDIERLIEAGIRGGRCLCKLDKMEDGKLVGTADFSICDIDHPLASTVTARYYKGVSAHKDNMVIEIWKLER